MSPVTSTCISIATDHSRNQRSGRVDNASLEPTGRLSLQLNRSVDQNVDEAKKKARCALHYLAAGIRYKVQIVDCLSCNIILCTKCYGLFHRVQDFNSIKHRIKTDILNDI